MKRLLFLPLALVFAFMLVSCDSGNTGDFKITLKLPYDDGICSQYDSDEDNENDYSYCINRNDQVSLVIYSKQSISDEYVYADRKLITADKNDGGKDEFIRSLKKGSYYRFFVEVTNENQKLKLTGGIDGILYDDANNYDVDIFLAPVGDFARVVSDRKRFDENSLESYFDEDGSKGSAAVAFKDGSIYMAGGYDFAEDSVVKRAVVFDMKTISKKNAKQLPIPIYDHIAALVDDGSETGKVVVGLGMSGDDELNDAVWVYDPKNDKYEPLALGSQAVTKAKAITIDGDVYVVGGCTDNGASNAVYKISADESGRISTNNFATLNAGRCNHAIADVSTVDENGNKTVRILVVGGSTNYKPEGKETPVTGDNFAEIVTQGSSKSMTVSYRNGDDEADLKVTGLIAPAAVSVSIDGNKVVSVLGGYILDGEDEDASWIANPRLFVLSENGDKLVYDANSTPNECSRPSAALLGTGEEDSVKYVAVNCGSSEISRKEAKSNQTIFVLQVKATSDSYSSSVKESLMTSNYDNESTAGFLDGPVAVDAIGQVFMLGGKFVYQVGSYAVP